MVDDNIKDEYIELINRIAAISKRYFFEDSLNELHPRKTEEELKAYWNMPVPQTGDSIDNIINELEEGFMTGITGIANPKFLGYILTRPVPQSHAFDILVNATHATPGATHLSLSATLIERCVLRWFSEKMGITDFNGMFTSCGSISNLIALKCARDQVVHREKGIVKPITVYGSTDTHYSLRRAWDVLGGGIDQVRLFDNKNLESLKQQIIEDRAKGFLPVAIMGNLGTTNTGEIEPLEELIKIARGENLWFHIDGAYGAPILFLDEYSSLREIVAKADSINIDPHKWIGMPAGTSSIYINRKYSFLKSYAFGAQFLDFQNMDCDTSDQCQMGIEGTRRFYGLRVWGALKLLGFEEIERRVRKSIKLAQFLKELLEKHPEFKILNSVELSIVTFAVKGFSNEMLLEITREMFENNEAFITVTKVGNENALRCAIIGYETTEETLKAIVDNLVTRVNRINNKL